MLSRKTTKLPGIDVASLHRVRGGQFFNSPVPSGSYDVVPAAPVQAKQPQAKRGVAAPPRAQPAAAAYHRPLRGYDEPKIQQ